MYQVMPLILIIDKSGTYSKSKVVTLIKSKYMKVN